MVVTVNLRHVRSVTTPELSRNELIAECDGSFTSLAYRAHATREGGAPEREVLRHVQDPDAAQCRGAPGLLPPRTDDVAARGGPLLQHPRYESGVVVPPSSPAWCRSSTTCRLRIEGNIDTQAPLDGRPRHSAPPMSDQDIEDLLAFLGDADRRRSRSRGGRR